RAYLAAYARNPAAVLEELRKDPDYAHMSKGSIKNLIREARLRDVLTESRRGVAGAEMGPRFVVGLDENGDPVTVEMLAREYRRHAEIDDGQVLRLIKGDVSPDEFRERVEEARRRAEEESR